MARARFIGQEIIAIAGDNRLHDRMLGHVGLHITAPDKVRAASAARDLVQKLECAFGGARIGTVGKTQIAVDDADEGKAGEVVALGDDLRADDDVDVARLDAADHVAHFGQARDQVGRKQRDAGVRKAFSDFLRHALDTRAAGDKTIGCSALRTLFGKRQREAAVVAIEAFLKAVLDQPRRALRTFDAVAAGAAQRQRRVSAPIKEQQ